MREKYAPSSTVYKVVAYNSDLLFHSHSLTQLHSHCLYYQLKKKTIASSRTAGIFVTPSLETAMKQAGTGLVTRVLECRYMLPLTRVRRVVKRKSRFDFIRRDRALQALVSVDIPLELEDRVYVAVEDLWVTPAVLPIKVLRVGDI